MLITIPDVLSPDEVAHCRRLLAAAPWQDGKASAGAQAAHSKNNRQIPFGSEQAEALGRIVLGALSQNALFLSAALPKTILPPMFNAYGPGENFGVHVDNAIRVMPDGSRIRTDLSMTLFFSNPEDYEGGELVIETLYGAQEVKLPAGHMVLYPSTSLHQVLPVTRGERVSSFFWLQSMIRDDSARTMLFDLDQSIQSLSLTLGTDNAEVVSLTGLYHNLIRKWAEL